jgi:AcrR family transcriptional regulator
MAYRKHLPAPPKYKDPPTWKGNSYDVGSRIVRTAWQMLFEKDAADITLREVAHEVGVSSPAAYNHFKDRGKLFAELAWGGFGMLGGPMIELIPDGSEKMPRGLLPSFCKIWLKFAKERPRHYALMFSRELNDPNQAPRVFERRANLRLMLRAASAAELGFEPATADADVAFALLHGTASMIASGDPAPPAKQVAAVIARHLAGLRKRKR